MSIGPFFCAKITVVDLAVDVVVTLFDCFRVDRQRRRASKEMKSDKEEKDMNASLTESGDGGNLIRQVTIPTSQQEDEGTMTKLYADNKTAAKRSLFPSNDAQQEESQRVGICPPQESKRVKRSLDYVLPQSGSEDSACPSDFDSRASTPTSLEATQEVEFSQDSTIPPELSAVSSPDIIALCVVCTGDGNKEFCVPLGGDDFSIGRYESNDFSIFSKYVSSFGHIILKQATCGSEIVITIHAEARNCWVASDDKRRWNEVEKGRSVSLAIGQHFCLICPPKQGTIPPDIACIVKFRLVKLPASVLSAKKRRFSLVPVPTLVTPQGLDTECDLFECRRVEMSIPIMAVCPGSASFDQQYKLLLETIRDCAHVQENKKGSNMTLGSCFGLEINLSNESAENDGLGKFLLPVTTLRSLYGARPAIVESMFYLRGEENITFLRANGQKFWDKQADDKGFIGLNYGLLTCFPQPNNEPPINQLESKVIQKLVKHECSRNMVCSLMKPGECTTQEACTASIQFSVNKESGREVLDMTVNQRSSDVILGLPHDICCWSIILHLVRREVFRRSRRRLAAGRIFFIIAAGGAHVYDINKDAFEELLQRKPILLDDSPELLVETDVGMFDMAQNYKAEMVRVKGYTSHHPAIRIKQAL